MSYKKIGMIMYDHQFNDDDFNNEGKDFNRHKDTELKDIYRSCKKNLGNGVFTFSALKIFEYDEIILINEKNIKNKEMDIIVLLLANIIRNTDNNEQQASRLYNLIKDTDIPIFVMSIGVQNGNTTTIPTFGPSCTKLMKLLAEKCKTIGVRGEYTKKVFSEYGIDNTDIIGCPSIFMNDNLSMGVDIEKKYKEEIKSLGVSFPGDYKGELSKKLCKIIDDNDNDRVFLQSGEEIIKVISGISDNHKEVYKKIVGKDGSDEKIKDMFEKKIEYYNVISDWKHGLQKHSHFIAPRIHGSIMAISAELATICISIDSRVKELCDVLCIPYINQKDFVGLEDYKKLWSEVKFDGKGFDKNRKELAQKYIDLFEENNIQPKESLLKFI